MKTKRVLFLALIFLAACTSFQEEDFAPVGISVDVGDLAFTEQAETQTVTVHSGSRWNVSSKPEWIRVQLVDSGLASSYEWHVVFASEANYGYDRSGAIVFGTGSQSISIPVFQKGKKGTYVAVESISVSRSELTMTIGETQWLYASFVPSNASDQTVTWSSSNTSVATVSSLGQVTANAVGTTTITVTAEEGGKKAACVVTVKPVGVSSVTLDKQTLTLRIGETSTLTATVLPSDAANKNVSWSSSNASVATVDSNGKVTGISVGSAMITVTTDDGGKTASCSVTVNPISVTGVSLNKTSMSLLIGGTEKLTVTVTPSNATNKNVMWSSSNTSIATVDSNGNVSGIKVGTAVITVKTEDGGKTATCAVTVNPISVTGVSLNQTSLTMTEGDTQTLTATITPSNATDKTVTWSSSNTSVATIS